MTTDKAFKRVVRARMAKTGERYAAARRTLVEGATDGHHAEPTADAATPSGYRMRGGLHPETATLANVLANQGVVSGLTGEPLTEAAILGIGGGLGAGYILWEFKSHDAPVLTLGFRNQWQYPSIPGWTGKTLDRLGIEPDLHETGGAKGAREALDARLDAGVPVIASVDLQSIGTWGQPDALSGHFGLVVVVFGRDADGSYLVDDRGRNPFRVSPAVMAAARGRIGSFKHRIVGLRTTPGPIPAERLRAAMRAGLEDQVDHLRSPSDSFSLPAWRFGQPDTYIFFFKLGIDLLAANGRLGYITPNTYLVGANAATLRGELLSAGRIEQIVDLPQGIWADANVDCVLIFLAVEADEEKRRTQEVQVNLLGIRGTLDKLVTRRAV